MRRSCLIALCVPVLLMAACTGRDPSRPSDAASAPGTTAPVTPGSTAPSAAPTPPPATAGPATPKVPDPTRPPNRGDCVASTEEATVRPNEEVGPICVRVGAKIRFTSAPSPTMPWQPLGSSDDAVVSCASTNAGSGGISGVCTASRVGSVTLSTKTKTFNDGASDYWRMTVTVVA